MPRTRMWAWDDAAQSMRRREGKPMVNARAEEVARESVTRTGDDGDNSRRVGDWEGVG